MSSAPAPAPVAKVKASDAGLAEGGQPAKRPRQSFEIPSATMFPQSFDDETAAVLRLVRAHCMADDVEIEARLGVLRQRVSGQRIKNAYSKSSFIVEDAGVTFDARVAEESFFKVNQEMNRLIEAGLREPGRTVKYAKSKTVDFFSKDRGSAARHTYSVDLKTGGMRWAESVVKNHLDTVDVFNPGKAWDVRFRASTEEQATSSQTLMGVAGGEAEFTAAWLMTVNRLRRKERRSYTLDCFRVDLTTVHTCKIPHGGLNDVAAIPTLDADVSLEIEVELDTAAVRAARAAGPDALVKLCRLFVDNIRGLAAVASGVRNATLPPMPLGVNG